MIQCPSCGALVPDSREYCPNCDCYIPAGAARAPVRPAMTTEPAYGYQNPTKTPTAVLNVGGFVGSMVLLSIPGLGLLLMIIWSCGGCRNHNRRNLSRAYLILWLFTAAVTAGAILILKAFGIDVMDLFSL